MFPARKILAPPRWIMLSRGGPGRSARLPIVDSVKTKSVWRNLLLSHRVRRSWFVLRISWSCAIHTVQLQGNQTV